MTTLYITSNADSGDGTLRAVIAASGNNDIITPYPGLELVVEPASPIALESNSTRLNITLNGDNRLTIRRNSSFSTQLMTIARGSQNGQTLIKNVKFENSQQTGSRKCFFLQNNGSTLYHSEIVFDGCTFAGHTNSTGAICNQTASQIANQQIIFKNCAFLGNRSTSSATLVATGGALIVVTIEGARCLSFVNCSFIGNLTRYIYQFQEYAGEIVDCKQDVADLVAGPPANWSSSTWTPTAWRDWNPHILSSSADARGYNSSGERYDIEGNPRDNGTLGAFETIDADLYWIGTDSQGEEVTEPSLDSAAGWSTDRFAENGNDDSEGLAPSSALSLYVGNDAAFSGTWAPSAAATLIIGAGAVSGDFNPASADEPITAWIGTGTLTASGKIKLGDGRDLASLVPNPNPTIEITADEVEADAYTLASGVSLIVKTATIGTLTISGGSLIVKESANVPTAFTLAGSVELGETALLYAPTATLTSGLVTAAGTRAYFAVPSTADASQVEIDSGVIRLNTDAGATNFRADTTQTTVEFSWSAATPTALEKVAPYELLSASAVPANPPEAVVTTATEFRLWSGSQWLTATATPSLLPRYWTVEKWILANALVDDVAFTVDVWGLAPDVVHTASEDNTAEENNDGRY